MTTTQIAIGGLVIGLLTVIATFLIDLLNSRRLTRDKKYEILSQISQKSYHAYRAVQSHVYHKIHEVFNITYFNMLINSGDIIRKKLQQETDDLRKSSLTISLNDCEVDKEYKNDLAKYHKVESEKYGKLMEEIDSELQGLKTLFNGFFDNNIVRLRINQITEFELFGDNLRKIENKEFENCIKNPDNWDHLNSEMRDGLKTKFLKLVKSLNQEITREMRKKWYRRFIFKS